MNWKVRSDDGKQAVLDIGDWGASSFVAAMNRRRPRRQPPPRHRRRRRQAMRGLRQPDAAVVVAAVAAEARRGFAVWAPSAGASSRGTRRRWKPSSRSVASIPWRTTIRSRISRASEIKDPNGFDLRISNGNRKNRRQKPASAKLAVPAPFEATNWKTVWLDHLSFECTDYKEAVAFYDALLGWKPGTDEGSQNQVQIGDIGDAIIRRGGGGGRSREARRLTRRQPSCGVRVSVTSPSASSHGIPMR